jgi:hypothetical protein
VLRAVIGSAAALALAAVLGLAAGAILRRSAGAITAVIVLLVVPQLAAASLPVSAGRWLLRATPSAGFAIQQTVERGLCLPEDGCFPRVPGRGSASSAPTPGRHAPGRRRPPGPRRLTAKRSVSR